MRPVPRFVFVSVVVASLALAQHHSRLAPELQELDPSTTVDVIIQYNRTPSKFSHSLVEGRGGRHHRTFESIKSAHYTVPVSALADLANDPDVAFVHPDRAVQATGTATPDYGWMGVLGVTDPNAWSNHAGSGVGVAVIDSGINDTWDLTSGLFSRIVYSKSFVPGDWSTADAYGHGTHVAGIIGGDGSGSTGASYVVRGVAPSVRLINLRVLDKYGASTDSSVIAAIQKAISLKYIYNIRVINLSLGRPVAGSYVNDPLCQAVEAAWNAGIVVVVAAGNGGRYAGTQGYGTISSPGNDPYVITVGAMNTMATLDRSDDKMASYSAKGPTLFDHIVKPDLVAPGNRVFSILAVNSALVSSLPQNIVTMLSKYFQLSGTSMAAPMVSGAVAVLLDQNSSLTPDQVKAKLMRNADKTFAAATCPSGQTCATQASKKTTAVDPITQRSYNSYYDMFTVGAGYLNVAKALADGTTVPSGKSSLSPSVSLNTSTGAVTLVTGSSVTWGSSVSWGTSVIWGTNTLSGSSVTWGTSVIWGTNSANAQSVIWGSSVIWGTSAPSADNLFLSLVGEQ